MKALIAACTLSLLPCAALADEPTVALTQSELSAVVDNYVAQYAAQTANVRAKPAIDKINAAFAPKPSEPTPTPEPAK